MPPARASRVEHGDVVAERREIARDGQRRGARADAARCACRSSAPAGFGRRSRMSSLLIGGDALQPADRDRLGLRVRLFALDASAAAGGLARTVAGAPENSRETRSISS